jgi:hypothetical protein
VNTQVMERPAAADPQPKPTGELSVVQYLVQSGASVEQVQAALELQVRADNHKLEMMREKRRMDEEDRKVAALLAFRRDFAAFRGENIIIPKSKYVDRGKAGSFHQAEYGAVMQMISPALSRHGFSLRHNEVFGSRKWTTDGVESDVPWVYVTCYLEHRDGHSERLDLEGPPGELSANTPVQNMQATGSYLKRQSALAITGTATADEDDEGKMRRRTRSNNEPADDGEAESLLGAGRDQALKGMKALTDWWASLTAKQRTALSPEFPGMRKAAQAADEGGK